MRVFVTGASGLVGAAAARALALAGSDVRVLRHRSAVPSDFEVVQGDLEDRQALRAALEGTGAVVHAAAALGGDEARLQRVNVEGSERLFRLALEAGVGRVVFVSTAGVYSPGSGSEIDEDHPTEPDSEYCRSKRDAEVIGRRLLGDGLTVLRPVTVYRTGFCPLLDAMFRLLEVGAPIPHTGRADVPVDTVHADDLAQAVVAATSPRRPGGTYNIAGPRTGFRDLISACAARLGIDPNWAGIDSNADFDATALHSATVQRTVSIDRARQDLGFRPTRRWAEEIAAIDEEQYKRDRGY